MPGDTSTVGDDGLTAGEPEPQYYKLPGQLNDLDNRPAALKKWSSSIDQVVETLLISKKAAGKTTHFFNAAREPDTQTETLSIKWLAFPKNLDTKQNKWALADQRSNQDEYCEWEVERIGSELKSVTFTTELPEYYTFLASIDKKGDRLLQLYNDLNPQYDVTTEDILDGEKYNGANRFNSRPGGEYPTLAGSIAHMISNNNTLRDLAELVIDSSILHKDENGNYITNGRQLIQKMENSPQSQKRNSDPTVASNINARVRGNKRVAVTNPLGPYIKSIENSKIKVPGTHVDNWWTFDRVGADGHRVRAKFTIPDRFLGKVKDENGNKVVYGSHIAQHIWIGVDVALADASSPSTASKAPQTVLSYIEGRHIKPIPLPVSVVNRELRRDPFGKYLATTPAPALTLKDLIESLEDYTWTAYAADEGIGYTFKAPRTQVRVRVVVICTPGKQMRPANSSKSKTADPEAMTNNAFKRPTFAVVAVAPQSDPNNIHSKKSILQVASFNSDDGFFRFYDRERLGRGAGAGQWLYFGSSMDAFAPDTQGLGSQSWRFDMADRLAIMVTTGTKAWFSKRRYLDFGPIRDPKPVAERVHQWMAHVLMTTTVSISCSKSADTEIKIPSGFFINSAALSIVMDDIPELHLGTRTTATIIIVLIWSVQEDQIQPCTQESYEAACRELGLFTLNKMPNGGNLDVATEGEGFAPWKVLTPCPEDREGIERILESGLLPKKVLIALLMVDFWNPIFSYRRARLMRYIPSTLVFSPAGSSSDDRYLFSNDLAEAIQTGIESLELNKRTSPEAEFLELLSQPDLEQEAKRRIQKYVNNINAKLATKEGVLGYMRLAESKRRMFRPPPSSRRPVHPLAEFDLSLPYASKMPSTGSSLVQWIMKPDASVVSAESDNDIWHPRNTQAHFSSAGCPFSASF
ncbi:hypothetical protein DL765_002814 [Monosporascus sp. GIB2]|nr:hypothetical protein DL765_002814 [Monosporascus sp. GIB2]